MFSPLSSSKSAFWLNVSVLVGLGAWGYHQPLFAQNAPVPAETLPANGSINDLEGLQEREGTDWFSGGQYPLDEEELEINDETYEPTVNDPEIIRKEEQDWQNRGSGEPRQSGGGIPLGEF